jgi:hypothetical protein
METQYDVKGWAEETSVGRRVFNYNFHMSGGELAGWQLVKTVPMHADRQVTETTYLWQSEDAPGRHVVRVNIAALANWRAAQKHLVTMLAHTMRPDLPRASGALAAVGDIEFVARMPETDVPAAVLFARGNIAVAVNSVGSVAVDVSDIAETVDRLLTESPAKLPPSVRRSATRLSPKVVDVKKKDGVMLVKSLRKTGDLWLKVIASDGELHRKADALVYKSAQPGRRAVEIFSIRRKK